MGNPFDRREAIVRHGVPDLRTVRHGVPDLRTLLCLYMQLHIVEPGGRLGVAVELDRDFVATGERYVADRLARPAAAGAG